MILKINEFRADRAQYSFFQINFQLGRNFPITNNVLLTTQLIAPIFKPYSINKNFEYSYREIEEVALLQYSGWSRTTDNNFSKSLENTMNKFTAFTLNMGLKIHF